MAGLLNNFNIETGGTKEEAAKSIEYTLRMEIEEDGEDGGLSE